MARIPNIELINDRKVKLIEIVNDKKITSLITDDEVKEVIKGFIDRELFYFADEQIKDREIKLTNLINELFLKLEESINIQLEYKINKITELLIEKTTDRVIEERINKKLNEGDI